MTSPETGVRLLEILLPAGGYLAAMMEAYFDESGSHEGSPLLCVAGYLFEKGAASELSGGWQKVLDQYGLPYFRMSSCAHGNEPFDKMSKGERILCESAMIGLIKKHSIYGFAATVNEAEFMTHVGYTEELGGPYSFLVGRCLSGVKVWADQFKYNGDIAYFFEAGHAHQNEANAIMNGLYQSDKLRTDHRLASHTFADKRAVLPLQAADMMAWHWFTEGKRVRAQKPYPRKDTERLIRTKVDRVQDWKAHQLIELSALYDATAQKWREIEIQAALEQQK